MNCDFCDEINNIETIYNKIYGGKSRVVCSTEHFIVFPCMGQLREGHLLIISKKHINAIGLLDVLAMEELRRLLFAIVGYFKNEYGKELLCFEHGALSDDGSYGGCGIFHMHLHLLPIIYDEFLGILNYVKNQDTNAVNQVRDLTDTRQYAQSSKTYIFLSCIGESKPGESYVVTNENNYFASQYMRKAICDVIGKTNWDWRKISYPEPEFIRTLEKSFTYFSSTSKKL